MTIGLTLDIDLQHSHAAMRNQLVEHRFASRLFQQDATLWGDAAAEEAAQRLGWVDPFACSKKVLAEAEQLRDELHARSINRVILCGMGGSSLGPEVIARAAGVELSIVDSTHPEVLKRALSCDLAHTAIVISSKSGNTLETLTHAELFREQFLRAGLDPAAHIIYVTDPGSPLTEYAEKGYRVFLADPNVGGRFSVLTAFGIVPTVLAGVDMKKVLTEAKSASETLRRDSPENPALVLAATIAAELPARYVLLLGEPQDASCGLGDWIEQLVAESTGKQGKGVLPIALDPFAHEFIYPPANSIRVFLGTSAVTPHEIGIQANLGEQLLLWEVATAALGALLGINPFDQPDVEAAKIAAHKALGNQSATSLHEAPASDHELSRLLCAAIPKNGYLTIQAFVDPESPQGDHARQLRNKLAATLGVPVALGWGPRYLHSTGQLHKGGPPLGVYLQLRDSSTAVLGTSNNDVKLTALLRAQADGDRDVLESRGRTVILRES